MLQCAIAGGRTKGANEKSFVFVHQHGGYDGYFRDKHSSAPRDLTTNFTILKKCNSKVDSLIYEMFFINKLRPSLNVQRDSIRAKVFK